MSTFLFASIPIPAHTLNPIVFAQRLVDRGHRVLWYAGGVFHERLRAIGAEPLPYLHAEDFGGQIPEERWPELAEGTPAQIIGRAFNDVFVGHAPGRVADLRAIVAEHDVDAILCDGLMYGAGMVGELDDIPWATFGDGPLPFVDADTPPFGPALSPMRGPLGRLRNRLISAAARRFIFGDAQRTHDGIRAELGLPHTGVAVLEAASSPYLHLQGCTPGFEYPRRELAGQVHWVGALAADAPSDWAEPAWWPEITTSDRPIVLVSQGTIRPDVTELLAPTVRALANENVTQIVTTGAADPLTLERALGGQVPGNARIVRHVPYGRILPHVDAFVTNGGYTGVTLALAHGVPVVQAGTTEEKTEIAARIRWSGVGITLGTTRPSVEQVRRGVRRVLDDIVFADAAERIQAEMRVHDAGEEGADLLEELALTRRPVLRAASAVQLPQPAFAHERAAERVGAQ